MIEIDLDALKQMTIGELQKKGASDFRLILDEGYRFTMSWSTSQGNTMCLCRTLSHWGFISIDDRRPTWVLNGVPMGLPSKNVSFHVGIPVLLKWLITCGLGLLNEMPRPHDKWIDIPFGQIKIGEPAIKS